MIQIRGDQVPLPAHLHFRCQRLSFFALFALASLLLQRATPEMVAFLKELRATTHIGMVGGSDLSKQKEQLGDDVLSMFDYVFPENGLMAFKEGKLIATTSLKEFLGEAKLKAFINAVLAYLSTLDIPIKR